jgi:hypothetical protein
MKQYNKTNTIAKKLFTLMALALFTFNFGQAAEKIVPLNAPEPNKEIDYGNAELDRLVSKINDGYIFNAHISSTTVKKDGSIEKAFTTFGSGPLNLIKNGSVSIKNVKTAFNDRNDFQSKKTVESITLSSAGKSIKIRMQFHTWAQSVVELSNAKITKERFGYFLTGSQSNGSKTVYYTIVISHRGKLI